MSADKVYKVKTTRLGRFFRLIRSTLDPRAFGHAMKIVNYYNYHHLAELRKVSKGQGLRISPTASFANGQNIVLGDRVHIGAGSSLWAGPGTARIILSDDVLIAPNTMITAANYRFNDGSPVNDQAMDEADILVGKDVWIGYGAVILAGSVIGDGAIIGAGAVVRGTIPPNAIVAGNPGQIIGYRHITGRETAHVIAADATADATILDLIRGELTKLGPEQFDRPLAETAVDSFDLITLRMALETKLALSIPDREWGGIATLADIAKLPSLTGAPAQPAAPSPQPAAQSRPPLVLAARADSGSHVTDSGQSLRKFSLNMPQMALTGLGEPWLFKEVGDIHWAMITAFLKSPSSAIKDEMGDRLYATFTRFQIEVTPSLRGFRENDTFEIASSLERFGASMFFGTHDVTSANASCRARTMSTFAKYGERGANTSLIKGAPLIDTPDRLPSLDRFPEFGTEYRARRAQDPAETLFECEYEILPPHDINGVGLLYFASYPSVFDLCLEQLEGKGFLLGHSTVSKDLLYYANSEPTETLIFKLHAREDDGNLVRHTASLSRESDGKRMAEVVSVKQRSDSIQKSDSDLTEGSRP